ncbi:hypothetical protein FDUTEX481_08873 [Tolypothrix sp. PCC 7601]|uniref:Uncharacterized protein n=1 Tax=Microchaete diplosiphon TaxID=1197 RepID=Q6H007_MICDP|nr:hypothetical protein [Fremyella diplosiphon Fd33]EKF00723.1 hypothetical protein FDUTEX481_08873 [Tolypothrix sp. PCC 7601]
MSWRDTINRVCTRVKSYFFLFLITHYSIPNVAHWQLPTRISRYIAYITKMFSHIILKTGGDLFFYGQKFGILATFAILAMLLSNTLRIDPGCNIINRSNGLYCCLPSNNPDDLLNLFVYFSRVQGVLPLSSYLDGIIPVFYYALYLNKNI